MANPRFKENKFKRAIAKSLQPILKVINKKAYVSLQYRYITNHKLNWKLLSRYTEKLQYLRLYYYPINPNVIRATSRVGAREIVSEKGLEKLLIPLVGIYYSVAEIDFETLPNSFVIKASHASGFNFICRDKSTLDIPSLKQKLHVWLKQDYGKKTVEPHYSKVPKCLIIEHYMGIGDDLPTEYKIHVFNGIPRYLYVVQNRGKNITYDNLYIDFTPFDGAQFNHWESSKKGLNKPKEFDEMVEYCRQLGGDLMFCRVDFFLVNNKIYFNEFTFTPAKGTLIFDDDKADFEIGRWLDISSAK